MILFWLYIDLHVVCQDWRYSPCTFKVHCEHAVTLPLWRVFNQSRPVLLKLSCAHLAVQKVLPMKPFISCYAQINRNNVCISRTMFHMISCDLFTEITNKAAFPTEARNLQRTLSKSPQYHDNANPNLHGEKCY